MIKIKRALISVADKKNLADFVQELQKFGVEIVSTGGTAKFIQALKIPVKKVSDFTGCSEMLDGRVKTLHPKLHGGILAIRDNQKHKEQIKAFNIELIDMVVVNLYPFEKVVLKDKVKIEEAIENIDIGGPAMLRSAAKNYQNVAVIIKPEDYKKIIDELKVNEGRISKRTCFKLACEVFKRTSEYDQAIAVYLQTKLDLSQKNQELPEIINLNLKKIQSLRYGENPHQKGAFYKENNSQVLGIADAKQLHGKELSFNNILDLDAALNIVKNFDVPAVSIIKHNNPCGAATAKSLCLAYQAALECDPLSAFGSIVGANRIVEQDTAAVIIKADFIECLIAPGFSQAALNLLKQKKNLRILEIDNLTKSQISKFFEFEDYDFKRITGGLLVQDKDVKLLDNDLLKFVTSKKPSENEMNSLIFAWKIVKNVKSNAIVLAQGTKTVGIGAGQMSRVDSVIIAIRKSQERAKGAVLASDAFFPKSDAIIEAAKAGVTAIIQPGGSKEDQKVIAAAEESGIAMVLTGCRHFKH
ncbi:MAG: bifunctional phosphoribosylaminoimidazolecarboxamide formyltransferase/IMP cyclohydrolase [Candidatus Omnitrophota bacterium]